MNKLIKEIEFGKYNFKIAINRDIALKCAEEFPEFMANILDNSRDVTSGDVSTLIRNNKLRELLDNSDYVRENCPEVVKFALPLMLKEAGSKEDANEIINYAIENEADEIFNINVWNVILMGFMNNGEAKTPKVTFKMK